MVRHGKVISIEHNKKSCFLRDERGTDWLLTLEEYDGEKLPPLFSVVSFEKDTDYKFVNVAMLGKLYRLPRVA